MADDDNGDGQSGNGQSNNNRQGHGRNKKNKLDVDKPTPEELEIDNYWHKWMSPLRVLDYRWKVIAYRGNARKGKRHIVLDSMVTAISWEDALVQKASISVQAAFKGMPIKEGHQVTVFYAPKNVGKWTKLWTLRVDEVSVDAKAMTLEIQASDELAWLKKSKDDFTYKKGKGFGAAEWWGAVRRAAGGRSFEAFNDRYIDGREPFPYDTVLPLAGLKLVTDSMRSARLGINTTTDSTGTRVTMVAPDGAAAAAGVQAGDLLLALGDIAITGEPSFQQFRATYGNQDGASLPIRVRRGDQELTLAGTVRLVVLTQQRLVLDPNASAKAQRIRHGIFSGTTGS